MTGNKRDSGAGDLFRYRTRLLGIASVVLDIERELLAKHAAGGIDISHGLFSPVFHLAAERGFAAGHRASHGNGDILRQCCAR